MTHFPGHSGCPKCVIDGGRLAAASRKFARETKYHEIASAAEYLAEIVDYDSEATKIGYDDIPKDRLPEVRAWAELDCHRAAVLDGGDPAGVGADIEITADLLTDWAHAHRKFVTGLFGGEYDGEYEIDVIAGIKKKDVAP